jgi:hypothetical protein
MVTAIIVRESGSPEGQASIPDAQEVCTPQSQEDFSACLQRAAKHRTVVLMMNGSTLHPVRDLKESGSFLTIITDRSEENLENLRADNLTNWIQSIDQLPFSAIAFSADIAEEIMDSQSFGSAAIRAIVVAISKGVELDIRITAAPSTGTPLTSEEKSSGVREVIENFNIEDIFPTHPWSGRGEESAAACYQALAAIFLRLNDPQSAQECLSWSDKFEDSPRSLALKAFIARENGETLGAVANMVSSLQQYELRKKENTNHYVSFTPRNIEVINSHLVAGLEALNNRNNEAALENFTQAVFNFDSFYSDFGLDWEK